MFGCHIIPATTEELTGRECFGLYSKENNVGIDERYVLRWLHTRSSKSSLEPGVLVPSKERTRAVVQH